MVDNGHEALFSEIRQFLQPSWVDSPPAPCSMFPCIIIPPNVLYSVLTLKICITHHGTCDGGKGVHSVIRPAECEQHDGALSLEVE